MSRITVHFYSFVKWPVFLSFLLLITCCIDFNPVGYTRSEPRREDLIGTWIPDQKSLADIVERGKYNTTTSIQLILHPDGSFEMINMPDWWANVHGASSGSFYSFSGTWKTFHPPSSTSWRLLLTSSNNSRPVDLLGQKPPYQLYFVLGDADENRGMIFVKK